MTVAERRTCHHRRHNTLKRRYFSRESGEPHSPPDLSERLFEKHVMLVKPIGNRELLAARVDFRATSMTKEATSRVRLAKRELVTPPGPFGCGKTTARRMAADAAIAAEPACSSGRAVSAAG
ncbi:hypothetical protein [Mesorhizobium sp. IMUNJ 23232]|uniref:hypothetical protein n=1 Tax=Mesorhizobium sp. IMUNJ 23232 TaxID=3376064 RepID=UPI0037A79046